MASKTWLNTKDVPGDPGRPRGQTLIGPCPHESSSPVGRTRGKPREFLEGINTIKEIGQDDGKEPREGREVLP